MIFNEPESVFSIISDLGHEHFQAETAQDRTEQKDDSLKLPLFVCMKTINRIGCRLQGYFNDKTRCHSISCSPIYW